MDQRQYLLTRIGPVVCPLLVAAAAFAISAIQSLFSLKTAPDAVLVVPFGLPFAAGLLLGWRAILPVVAGMAAWLFVASPEAGWLFLPAAAAEVAVAAWLADRPVCGGLFAAVVRGGLVGAAVAISSEGGWLVAAAATIGIGGLANALAGAVFAARLRLAEDDARLRLLESAVVHARDAVIILEAEPNSGPGRSVLYVNEAFTRMTGYSADEAVGRSLHFLRGPRSDPATLKRLKDALASGTPLQTDLLNYRKDGSELWVELSLVPVREPDGRCRHWVMIQRDISERKRAEEERERFFAVGAEMMSIGGFDGYFKWVSPTWERTLGWTAEELTARPWIDFVHPDDRAATEAEAAGLFAGRDTLMFENRYRCKDGSYRWISWKATAVLSEQRVYAGATDVTARRQAQEAVKRSEELFRGLFENAAAGVAVTDANGMFLSVNPAFSAILGRPAAEIVGRSTQDFTHPDDWAEQMPLIRDASAGIRNGYQIRKRFLRPDGSIVWTELSVAIVRGPAGEYVYGIGVAVNVTDRYRLEEQLRQAQKMEAVGQMAGGIAHDFNNLLTGVIGNLALVDLPDGDRNAGLVAAAETAANRAVELTRKLLGFARKNQLVIAPVRIGDLIREVVDILTHTLDPRIRIITDLEAPGPVAADTALVNQVLLNLCLNARDAMPDGGTLTLRAAGVTVTPEEAARHPDARPGEFVRVTVADTGQGMTPEVKARIFEPFYTTKPVGQGTGLGLPMVHGIVRQHNGWIECETAPGRGTRFDLYLPRVAASISGPVPRPADRSSPPDVATPPPNESRTVLLVDDEDMIRCLGRSVLEAAGYRVLEAHDGAAAVDLFRREYGRIDLVILDLTMPRLSGRDAFRSMTAIAPDARVLFSSGYSSDDLSDVTGAVGLLAKPYRPADLVTAVRQALDARLEIAAPAG
jgi:two-component system cell cycle sensor histidine kinase/response regulator CckA